MLFILVVLFVLCLLLSLFYTYCFLPFRISIGIRKFAFPPYNFMNRKGKTIILNSQKYLAIFYFSPLRNLS